MLVWGPERWSQGTFVTPTPLVWGPDTWHSQRHMLRHAYSHSLFY